MLDQYSMFDEAPEPPEPPPGGPGGTGDAADVAHSFFYAVVLSGADPARMHAEATRLDRLLAIGGKLLQADRLHVSLHAVGACVGARPLADIARWRRAGGAVRCAPFEVRFDRVATFGGEGNPLVLKSADEGGAAGLLALHQRLGMALADTGERIKARRITPHMTLSYGGRRIAETPIEPLPWQARELVLIDSHVGAHRHEVLGRWELGD